MEWASDNKLLSKTNACEWFKCFNSYRESLQDNLKNGCLSTLKNNTNMEAFISIFKMDT